MEKTENTSKERVMKIPLDDKFTLNIDRYNYWISEKRTAKESGRERDSAYCGFWRTLEDCLESYLHKRRVGAGDEISTFKQLIAHDKKIRDEIKAFTDRVVEQCGDMRQRV